MSKWEWSARWQSTDVEIKEEKLVYKEFFQVKSLSLRHRCFSGEWSDWLTREQICRQDAAAVILFDPGEDKIIMIEQFRTGIMGKPDTSPWMLEIVAGLLEEGENPDNTVIREAQEEAGATILTLIKIGEFYNSPGGFAEKTHVYCGIVDATGIGGIHGVGTEHEDICVHVLSRISVFNALEKGDLLTSASTVIALQWLKAHWATL